MSADLLRRLDDLERQLTALQSRRRIAPAWIAALALGVFGGWLGHAVTNPPHALAQQGGARDLEARSIKIVDDQQRTVLLLACDKWGGYARAYNPQGKLIANYGGDEDGGMVRALAHDGTERTFFGVGDKNGGGLVYCRGADGRTSPVFLGVGPRGGYLYLRSPGDRASVWIGGDPDGHGGTAHVYDIDGFLRCDVGSNEQGGMVNLIGRKSNKSHVFLGTGELGFGGLFLARDDNDKIRAEIGQNSSGGYLVLNGKNNQSHVSLATSPDQRGGSLQILTSAGKTAVELGVTGGGTGYIDTFEKK